MHDEATEPGTIHSSTFFLLATVFFLAAAAGLMVMSQAAGIVQAYGAGNALASSPPRSSPEWSARRASPAAGSPTASPSRASRWARSSPLRGAPPQPVPGRGRRALAMIGMGYGIISGVTAAAIARYWHKNAFGRVAGRLYVAWCIAAITLPVAPAGSTIAPQATAPWIAGGLNLARRLRRAPTKALISPV